MKNFLDEALKKKKLLTQSGNSLLFLFLEMGRNRDGDFESLRGRMIEEENAGEVKIYEKPN